MRGVALAGLIQQMKGYFETTSKLTITKNKQTQHLTIPKTQLPTLIDEVPILAVLASFLEKGITFEGLGELKVKESDRLAATYDLLKKAGLAVQLSSHDDLILGGSKFFSRAAMPRFHF